MQKNKTPSSLIRDLLGEACLKGASDIHLLPQIDGISVRLRVDGLLSHAGFLEKEFHEEIIAHLKVLAGLRSDEHFRPQDGRFRFEWSERQVDIRISIVPTYHGENAVLRLLNGGEDGMTLEDLGFSFSDQEKIEKVLHKRSGMILITGPTGSGKTSTLYALMSLLYRETISIITIEDPIEYALSGITQIQVASQTGSGFAEILRGILRQDPDIIMVGEIRDSETAGISIHAALTGHLVVSTLHTTDAIGALPRLIDMGIEPYLIASTVRLVVAQRLVRRKAAEGLAGRMVIAEVLVVTPELVSAVIKQKPIPFVRDLACKQGMTDMMTDGKHKVEKGFTTIEEVLRVISE
jgi:type II secretory ATPase GspE/PulE/Tfp pilus assembly ATPase PilB-like protein